MNCNELINLISEAEDLAVFNQTPGAAAHLKTCSGCRARLAFEEKLRQGFAGIASEAAPPDLAAKIMAIQAEQMTQAGKQNESSAADGWFDRLLLSLQGFPFKVAFAAGFTGFLAAVLILRQPQATPVSQPATIASGQRQELPAPAGEERLLLAKSENRSLQTLTEEPAKSPTMQMAMAPKERRQVLPDGSKKSAPALEQSDSKTETTGANDEERIPGAITFTLDSSEDAFMADKAAGAATLADQSSASEADMQLAMAPERERGAAVKAVSPAATSRFAPPVAAPPRLAASNKAESAAVDPAGEELRELLESSGIELPEGFIDIEDLAMRGYLPSEKLRRLRPPSGNGWYLQKTGDKLRVFLKKR
jgi:hypothetical protein